MIKPPLHSSIALIGLRFTILRDFYITSAVDVEEIVQEVFIKIWENREALDEEQKFCRILIYHDAQPCFQPFP